MRLIDAEDLKARAREEIGGMEEPFHSQFAILVEWLVDKTATAYDVEAVINEMECFAREQDGEPNAGFIDMCIDIVRGGVE